MIVALVAVCCGVPLVGVVAVVFTSRTQQVIEDAKREQAAAQVNALRQACKAYSIREGHWPESLEVLATGDKNTPPYLTNGPKELVDPWGMPYQYEFTFRDDGSEDVIVWTTDPTGVRIQRPEK